MMLGCPLCLTDFKQWNNGRKQLHLNACCEQAVATCLVCPACHKSFCGQPSRAHLKQCASRLNMQLIDLMTLSEVKPQPRFHSTEMKHYIPAVLTGKDGNVDEDMHTAFALSLSTSEEDKRRRSEAELAQKLRPTDFGPPSHLLLTEAQRQAIFSDRLANILLQIRKPILSNDYSTKIVSRTSRKFGPPVLWPLASGDPYIEDSTSIGARPPDEARTIDLYYVQSLVPPLSPAKSTWGDRVLMDSVKPNLNESKGFVPEDSTQAPLTPIKLSCYQNNSFTSMVGKTLCSDATLVVKDGKCVPVHRFVFASWGILEAVFPGDSNSVSVSEVTCDELLRLLFVLYSGDENSLGEQSRSLNESSLRLLTRWGLNVRAAVNVSELGQDEEVILSLVYKNSPKQRAAFDGSPVLRTDKPLSHCSPMDSPQTPLISNPIPCDVAPQFSRDLFSSICDTSTERTDTFDVQDRDSCWVEHVSDVPSISPGKSSHGASKESIFDVDSTPCPLLKRLRLSADEPVQDETSFSLPFNPLFDQLVAHSSIEPSVSSPSSAMGFTMDKTQCLAPTTPRSIRHSVTTENVATWKTPLSQVDRSSHSDSPITPLPNYFRMMTPELKRALSAYGVRPLPRKRAVTLLTEIYNQLHQYAPHPNEPPLVSQLSSSVPLAERNPNQNTQNVMGKLSSTNPSCKVRASNPPKNRGLNKTKSLGTSSGNLPHESPEVSPLSRNHSGVMCPFEVDDVDEPRTTEEAGQVELKAAVLNYIRANEDLYMNVLTYTPIDFDSLHQTLKGSGLHIVARKLMDILDEQCVTFTLRNRSRKAAAKPRSTRVISSKKRPH
ncbi:hypothetical protein EG68_09114 [Paragonimus skrjabini miyazakii]|uniref:Structure-specific endonuclease subunit SLX4 n=1 Tax=Paragonimus skrjabini miyazakii TaxID=59628 RepID=A0A8S9Y8K1_9TREM|nr:hypothetical protein EG68_09114 [Paragonimus skrjabini miyazakii]